MKISADRIKLDKVRDWPIPKIGNQMASFVRLCNYYRRLIPHFAEYAEPLYRQVLELRVTASDVLETAFAKLKHELCDVVGIPLPNPDKPFLVVETDAGLHGIGGLLLQTEGEDEYPMHFYKQALYDAQRNYCTYDRELLPVA